MEKINKYIEFYQSKFRILKDWDITYDTSIGKSKARIFPNLKRAIIGEHEAVVKGEINRKSLYVLHEMIHIGISAMKQDELEIMEELFVQDLCKLINN